MDILKEPAILFFILGIGSVFLKTGLEIPRGLSKFLSLYLLLAIGLKGGMSLARSGLENEFWLCLLGGLVLASLVPAIVYSLFSRIVTREDAAGIAASYGSVSAVTYIAGTTFLDSQNVQYSGAMTAVLAMMEAPAIVVALYLYGRSTQQGRLSGKIFHEAFLNSSVYLLLGSLLVGVISGPFGKESVGTLVFDLFKGLLCFFLMDLGIKAGSSLIRLEIPLKLIVAAVLIPLGSASLAMGWSYLFGISAPQAFLLTTLAAGASYIAVPAALQLALPNAKPGVYLTMALGVTFPFNVIFGIPLYWSILNSF